MSHPYDGRKTVSRVLYSSRGRSDGHPSGTPVTRRLLRPTRGRAGRSLPSYMVLLRVGFARPDGHPPAGALLPHLFTLTGRGRDSLAPFSGRLGSPPIPAVQFLWHFPSRRRAWALPSTLTRWSSDFPPLRSLGEAAVRLPGNSILAPGAVNCVDRTPRRRRLGNELQGGKGTWLKRESCFR